MIRIINYTISKLERSLSMQEELLRCSWCGRFLGKTKGLTKGEIVLKCPNSKCKNRINTYKFN